MNAVKPFRYREPLRVRRAEVDRQGAASGSHVLAWFDNAIAGYWRALALPFRETMARLQCGLSLRRATLELEASAHDDDALIIGLCCARIDDSGLAFEAACMRGEEGLAHGELIYACIDPDTGAGKPLPQALRGVLLAFEAGEAVARVRVGRWEALGPDARPIRTKVFIEEQGIPAEMEWDEVDAGCVHAVAYNRLGMPLATGRLFEHVPGTAKIGRMAVLPSVRGSGIGRAVLEALMDSARARGEREVLLHAQTSAAPFYLRAGFQPRGPQFDEAGIAHVEMVRGL